MLRIAPGAMANRGISNEQVSTADVGASCSGAIAAFRVA
jgi:hypothetical protein